MTDAKLADLFRRLIKLSTKQEALASQLHCTSANLSQYVNGTTIPATEKLAEWSDHIKQTLDVTFPLLFHYESYDRLLRLVRDHPNNDLFREALVHYDHVLESISDQPVRIKLPKTLEHFPKAFAPLAVVTGDRREFPPKTAGDIGAFSASPCEDKYLYDIALPKGTRKISDKVFVQLSERQLREKFGQTNLLVIGSPASNHLARIINHNSIFRFNLDPTAVESLDGIMQDARGKDSFQLRILQEQKLGFLKFALKRMFFGGLFDPTYEYFFRAGVHSDVRDYGVISLARNPYSDTADFVCVLVGGLHLPGTMLGLNLLSKPERFKAHPFGGVYQVNMDNLSWEEKIDKAGVDWDRNAVEPPDEAAAIDNGLQTFKHGLTPSRKELDETRAFLVELLRINSSSTEVKQCSSPPEAGTDN